MTKMIFVLMIGWHGAHEDDYQALWAIEGQDDCETVAEIFSLNSDHDEIFTCRPAPI